MRKMVIALLVLGVFAASSAFAANAVRFSQVYGGGGSTTGTFCPDYVELFNNSGSPIDMSGWQLQYGSATGLFASNTFTIAILPAGSIIPACGYYFAVVGSSATGTGCGAIPVTPDFINTAGPNMGAAGGKVALVPAGTATGQTCAVIAPIAIDMFGWGSGNCFEGTVAPAGSAVLIPTRKLGGMQDTDNNLNDFTNVPGASVVIHTAASGYTNAECMVVPSTKQSWGQIKTMYR